MPKITNRKIYFIAFWTLIITSFVFFAVVLIAYANGYHINPRTMHLQKTGIIVLNGNIKSVSIHLNNSVKDASLPYKFSGLIPAQYEVTICKDGYQDWNKVINVDGGMAYTVNNINLFFNNIQSSNNNTGITQDKIIQNFLSQNQNLVTKNYEIRFDGKLITRFSQNIISAVYDSNSNHFFIQLGNEVHVLDFDGSNNILLFKLNNADPITFYVNLPYIYFVQDNAIYQAIIQ